MGKAQSNEIIEEKVAKKNPPTKPTEKEIKDLEKSKEIADRLKKVIDKLGWDYATLSKKTEVTASTWTRIFKGQKPLKSYTILLLQYLTGVDRNWLENGGAQEPIFNHSSVDHKMITVNSDITKGNGPDFSKHVIALSEDFIKRFFHSSSQDIIIMEARESFLNIIHENDLLVFLKQESMLLTDGIYLFETNNILRLLKFTKLLKKAKYEYGINMAEEIDFNEIETLGVCKGVLRWHGHLFDLGRTRP